MMENFRFLNDCGVQSPNGFHNQVQAKTLNFNSKIYHLHCQLNSQCILTPTPICYPYKVMYCIANGSIGMASQHNATASRRYVNDVMQTATTIKLADTKVWSRDLL